MRPLRRITARLVPLALFLLSASVHAADVVEYYHTDGIGNVRVVTDATGAVIERHDYLPFGEEWCGTAVCGANRTPGQPLRFTGKERDAETGLDYFGARYYRANTGRFTTIDPAMNLRADLVDPQRWNRYAYSKNDPLRFLDPDGRDTTLITVVQPLVHINVPGVPEGTVGAVVHSALRIDNGGDPALYDPSGGYRPEKKGSDALLWGEDADLSKYIKARNDAGETVETITFRTTPEQESRILAQAEAQGDAGRPFGCATNVSAAVKGVGPFEPIGATFFPARLRRQMHALSGGKAEVHEPPRPPLQSRIERSGSW